MYKKENGKNGVKINWIPCCMKYSSFSTFMTQRMDLKNTF